MLGELLAAAQTAGTVRADVGVPEVKALLLVCKSRPATTATGCRTRIIDVVARRSAASRLNDPCTRHGRVLKMTLALATGEC